MYVMRLNKRNYFLLILRLFFITRPNILFFILLIFQLVLFYICCEKYVLCIACSNSLNLWKTYLVP